MSGQSYFKRVRAQTPTQFWINNVTREECRLAIDAGATGCTQNPSYPYKMLTAASDTERAHAYAMLDTILLEEQDDNQAQLALQRAMVEETCQSFMPLFNAGSGKYGYVSIQGDPFHEETETIVECALYNRKASPNVMAKVPATEEGLKAIEILAAQRVPINATEVFAVRQALDVCEVYTAATKGLANPAPIFYSHITGIYDEYLQKNAADSGITPDFLWQAGIACAKKCYSLTKAKYPEIGFIGGGARGLHHFTEMVGADACITINWKGAAEDLLKLDYPVVQRFWQPTPFDVIDELCEKLTDFRRGYEYHAIEPHEYESFGPVALFRSSFETAWLSAAKLIAARRASLDGAAAKGEGV
jgi:transaldolase